MKSRLTKFILTSLIGTLLMGMTVLAAEEEYVGFSVTPTSAMGYTNAETTVMADATGAGAMILNAEQCPDAIPLLITGITDTGYWQVDLGQPEKFYILGPHLDNITLTSKVASDSTVSDDTVKVETIAVMDSATAIAMVQNGVVTLGEEACIQYLISELSGTYVSHLIDSTEDIAICRYFYREYMKLYEQAKGNPVAYTSYCSGYFDDSIRKHASAVGGYFTKTIDNYAFGVTNSGTFYVPNENELMVYRTESLRDKGIFLK